jgi:hypothetical protein
MVFRYTVCSDHWDECRPVTQEYLIGWEADRDGGRVAGRGPRRPPSGAEGRPQAGRPGDPGTFLTRLMQSDANGDGKLSEDELPEPMRGRFNRMDANGDGFIDKDEIQAVWERLRARQ